MTVPSRLSPPNLLFFVGSSCTDPERVLLLSGWDIVGVNALDEVGARDGVDALGAL